jgi:riboflavin biosynthesis pyrimidine reductase
MACSIDGRIIFANWGNSIPSAKYLSLYNLCHDRYDSQGWLLGWVSLENDSSQEVLPDLIKPQMPLKRDPFVGDDQAETFAVIIDTKGNLVWRTNNIAGDHIIAILTEQVSDEYLYYLQRKSVSYIFAGVNEVDLKLAVEQLREIFSIERIMLEGDGCLNGSFFNAGLMDEISLLLLPIADGTPHAQTVFEVSHPLRKNQATHLHLAEVHQLEEDVLWLKYKINNK